MRRNFNIGRPSLGDWSGSDRSHRPGCEERDRCSKSAWVAGMKQGRAGLIAATYAENALDCAATGECVKGRAAIEDYMRARIAKLGRATFAAATSLGSVRQGDFVYEWGRSEVSFGDGQKVAHRYLTAAAAGGHLEDLPKYAHPG
jgi:hypothetical protein